MPAPRTMCEQSWVGMKVVGVCKAKPPWEAPEQRAEGRGQGFLSLELHLSRVGQPQASEAFG